MIKRRFFKIPRLGEPLGSLSFPLVAMPYMYRAIQYIYSRNLMLKGKNFTHFAKWDYSLFASLIDKVPHNIGQWVYNEMKRFRFKSKKTSSIPFPNLVSLLLFTENI